MSNQLCYGKVLQYNSTHGRGTIINNKRKKEKFYFDTSCFKDAFIMLEEGDKVSFNTSVDDFDRKYAINIESLNPKKSGKNNVKKNGMNDTTKFVKNNGKKYVKKDTNKSTKKDTNKVAKIYFGRIIRYNDKLKNGSIIRFDNGKCIFFNDKSWNESSSNIKCNVNISFKIRFNKTIKTDEAYNIRMTKQIFKNGYIKLVNKTKQFGFISTSYKKDIHFDGKCCKELNKLVIGDCVKYGLHYGKDYQKIVDVQLNENKNIIRRQVKGVIKNILKNKEKGYTLIFVKTKLFDKDICSRLDTLNVEFKKEERVVLDVFKNKLKDLLYGKYIKSKNIKKNSKNNDKTKITITINDETKKCNIIKNNDNVFIDDIIKQEMKNEKNEKIEAPKKDEQIYTNNIKISETVVKTEIITEKIDVNSTVKQGLNPVNVNKVTEIITEKADLNYAECKENNKINKITIKGKYASKPVNSNDNKDTIITKDMIDEITAKINELQRKRKDMIKKFYFQQNNVDVSENDSEICNNDSNSEDMSSINDSQYSH